MIEYNLRPEFYVLKIFNGDQAIWGKSITIFERHHYADY